MRRVDKDLQVHKKEVDELSLSLYFKKEVRVHLEKYISIHKFSGRLHSKRHLQAV